MELLDVGSERLRLGEVSTGTAGERGRRSGSMSTGRLAVHARNRPSGLARPRDGPHLGLLEQHGVHVDRRPGVVVDAGQRTDRAPPTVCVHATGPAIVTAATAADQQHSGRCRHGRRLTRSPSHRILLASECFRRGNRHRILARHVGARSRRSGGRRAAHADPPGRAARPRRRSRHDRPRRRAARRHRHRHRAPRLPHRRRAAARWRAARPACSTRTSTRSRRPGRRPGCAGGARTVKVQAPGPITLAAQLELPDGHRAITDAGALRDLAGSLAEGVAAHRAELARRLETHGRRAVRRAVAARGAGGPADRGVELLAGASRRRGGGASACSTSASRRSAARSRCTAAPPDLPWKTLQRSALHAVSVDVVDADGRRPRRHRRVRRVGSHGDARRGARRRAPDAPAVGRGGREGRPPPITDRLGFSRDGAARPDRRHAGVRARRRHRGSGPVLAIELAQKVADGFAEDPSAI